jgi:hypothetical protein
MDFQSVENAIVVARIKLQCKYTLPSFRISVRDHFDVPVSRKIICTQHFNIHLHLHKTYEQSGSIINIPEG